MERYEAISRLEALRWQDLRVLAEEKGVTVFKQNGRFNKGWAGHAVERYLGLPINSAQSPNLGTWELKVVPVQLARDGKFVVKETVAITMLDHHEVLNNEFRDSHLYTKLRKLIAVTRLRVDSQESSSTVLDYNAFELEETQLYDEIVVDYENIRQAIKDDCLSSSIGTYIQTRTKGSGHGSISRAFYARKNFVEYIIGMKKSFSIESRVVDFPVLTTEPRNHYEHLFTHSDQESVFHFKLPKFTKDCSRHSGKDNRLNRDRLDRLMTNLPFNQSGSGRHKCPYCAFEAGYHAGLVADQKAEIS